MGRMFTVNRDLILPWWMQCGTFVGTVTYMSPERIDNEYYSFPADIWSLGLSIFECGIGEFPYNASKGPVNLMLQVKTHHGMNLIYVMKLYMKLSFSL